MPEVRREKSGDAKAIRRVHLKAFEGKGEADLVDALRANEHLTLSFVAVDDGLVVGHVAYSPITVGDVEEEADSEELSGHPALAIAPIGVLPEYQRQGIGTELMESSLRECERRGYHVVVVLGDPEYYERFGFIPTSRFDIRSPFDVDERYFMLRAARESDLKGMNGTVRYVPEFDGLE